MEPRYRKGQLAPLSSTTSWVPFFVEPHLTQPPGFLSSPSLFWYWKDVVEGEAGRRDIDHITYQVPIGHYSIVVITVYQIRLKTKVPFHSVFFLTMS